MTGARGSAIAMADTPLGTITFLFTDIEGSTRIWEQTPRGHA